MTTPTTHNETLLDILVVGGGINGAGIAADAAGRGLNVGLYDAKDFASATSSASSKLIHGGLRYLEHYEFRLVSEALAEREVLINKAPHIAFPMRFRLPHRSYLRPAWMIRCGLFLYDHLGKRSTLPSSHKVNLAKTGYMKDEMKIGFEYSDAWVDDARLTLLNAQYTREKGGEVRNYCQVVAAERENTIWRVTLEDTHTGERFERKAKALVNATGPWVKQFYDDNLHEKSPRGIRMIKGSHIVVPRIHQDPQAYILQNNDGRIVFVIPYLDKFSLIGTTDVEHKADPRAAKIDDAEVDYLVDVVNQHFTKQLSRDDVVWSYSGVRPLCDDESDSPQAITRDYTIELEQQGNQAPLVSIFGGKLTTYRKLAESAMRKLAPFFDKMGQPWTANGALPGGDFSCTREQLAASFMQRYPWLTQVTAQRFADTYGTRTHQMLAGCQSEADMGRRFADGVYQAELNYLIKYEFVQHAEDALWRRTKLGLYLSEAQQAAIADYIEQQRGSVRTVPLSEAS
ncbi:glycerol-3-phosphate dehydrogenase [Salinivibrio proteolyticus]|uniref:glycerol-3-phosphate dehydrogenase n=1 Tax=Salinivibrio proteolyticus TaxID=334715 RepID=UPI00098922C3|nr:glycerol-3-phosphate dehydrogenase [Salinivibrio proteolyticus]OOF30093.1 glycerol-3-phosphate dehydrogenase [Salinivibrio proteolyticus]